MNIKAKYISNCFFTLGVVKIEVNSIERLQGSTPLHLAAENGYENVVEVLLEHKDVEAQWITFEFSGLFLALTL